MALIRVWWCRREMYVNERYRHSSAHSHGHALRSRPFFRFVFEFLWMKQRRWCRWKCSGFSWNENHTVGVMQNAVKGWVCVCVCVYNCESVCIQYISYPLSLTYLMNAHIPQWVSRTHYNHGVSWCVFTSCFFDAHPLVGVYEGGVSETPILRASCWFSRVNLT